MHLFYNRSGSHPATAQSSAGSLLPVLVCLALVITLQCLSYVVVYVSKHCEPKSCGLEDYLLFLPFLWGCSQHKRWPSFGQGQQGRGSAAGCRCSLSPVILGKVSRWCGYSKWGELRPSAEIAFLSPRLRGDWRAGELLSVLCSPPQTPAALQGSLAGWGLISHWQREHFLTGFSTEEPPGCSLQQQRFCGDGVSSVCWRSKSCLIGSRHCAARAAQRQSRHLEEPLGLELSSSSVTLCFFSVLT